MATAWTAIASTTVGSGGAATVTFSSIPQTYKNLIIKYGLLKEQDLKQIKD